jgi:D-sedoheptulose 7-phosphate isomerase/D-glycero-D-manno-heptose 1,7-bisphosphate phosphatase
MNPGYDLQTIAPSADRTAAKFPTASYSSAAWYFDAYAEEAARAFGSVEPAALDKAAAILIDAYTRRAALFACGNGGSAAIANHLQCDHLKAIRMKTDLTPRVVSLSTNVELLTAIANDLAYEEVFTYQLQSQASPGDVLIAISSSGRSPNIVRALTWARDHGLHTIALTGFDGGDARTTAEVSIHIDAANYGVVEDLHQVIMHALAQYIRQSRMTADTISSSLF